MKEIVYLEQQGRSSERKSALYDERAGSIRSDGKGGGGGEGSSNVDVTTLEYKIGGTVSVGQSLSVNDNVGRNHLGGRVGQVEDALLGKDERSYKRSKYDAKAF